MTATQTPFGLERLGPGDPLSSDGYAFQDKNPVITDFLLKIGAILHKHDAHAAMLDPTTAPTLAVDGTTGTVPAATTIYVEYTLTDPQGGETLPTDVESIVTSAGYADPTGAPDVVVSFAAGSLLANTFMYALSVTDGLGGETALGPPISVLVNPAANAEAVLSGFTAITNTSSGGAVGAGWRLWRSSDGGNTWDLMSTGPAATDGFTDDGTSPGDCSVTPLTAGTTGDTNSFSVTVPSAGQPGEAQFFSIYACDDGAFISPCLLGTYPIADYDAAQTYTALAPQDGSPPKASTCVGGANQINPDTDILNWPWKQPVATTADLPTVGNSDGDARIALDTHDINIWDAGTDAWIEVGGGGGGPFLAPVATSADLPTSGPPSNGNLAVTLDTYHIWIWSSGDAAWLDLSQIYGPVVQTDEADGYMFAYSDIGTIVEYDSSSGSPGTFTVPNGAHGNFPVGSRFRVFQHGTDQVTIAPDVAVTIDSLGGNVKTAGQFAMIEVWLRASNEWVLTGDLGP